MRLRTFADVNYDEIVPTDYRMNPDTEDVIYGDELEDGMIVLATSSYRENDQNPRFATSEQLLEKNRWCVISKLRKEFEDIDEAAQGLVTKTVYFIGLYSDSTKSVRYTSSKQGWLVRTDDKTLAEVTAIVVENNQAKQESPVHE